MSTRVHSNRIALAQWAVGLLALLATSGAMAQAASVFFSKGFSPATIGPGSTSTLVFDINSSENVAVTGLAFTDTLPAGVVIATPPSAFTTCGVGATLGAPAGGSTITLSGGELPPTPAGEETVSCQVSVNVTSSAAGVHTNVSGDLTSNLGNHGSATADLTVDTGVPGFSKSFSPATVAPGQDGTLTFTVDNTANASAAEILQFTDTLPAGLVIGNPANATTTCPNGDTFLDGPGTITANPGETTISVFGDTFNGNFAVTAGGSCTFSVDVIAETAGTKNNTSGDLTSSLGNSGKATAQLQVAIEALVKVFVEDPISPGGTGTLRFTITNFNRSSTATNIAFTDDLDATLSGLTAVGLPASDVCGTGSQISGTSVLSLTGGTLAPGASCSFDVTVQVPAGAAPGGYTNTTSAMTADLGGVPTTYNTASDVLEISAFPVLTKAFTDDPVIPGDTVTLEFTLTNTSATSGATDIAFTDDLGAALAGLAATTLPPSGFCGPSSTISGTSLLSVSGASLAAAGSPGDSCTFQVTLQVPAGTPGGLYPNTTSGVTATVDGAPVTGAAASDDLTVVAAPPLQKEFIDDPVQPGDTVTLEFTLTHDAEAAGDASGISFTDDLDAALSGLTATGLPLTDICGTGSQLAGDPDASNLSFTGGALSPGESCTFSVTLQVPAGAPSGNHANTTSNVQATVAGISTESRPATDLLSVAILDLTKSFTDDPVLPGAMVTLQFTVQNLSPSSSATDIQFTDDLGAVLPGLSPTDLPKADVCGTGSSLSEAGAGFIVFSGGSLAPGASCTFETVLQVPVGAASDTYANVTSGFSATVESLTVQFPNAVDNLTVDANVLRLAKSFTDDPAAPGGTANLEFVLENVASDAATDISFSDDLDAALSGLEALGLPQSDVCGVGSTLSGTTVLTLTGGNLPAGGTCTFSVTVQLPGSTPLGTDAVNTTSQVTGTVAGLAVNGDPATDTLQVNAITLAKSFDGPTVAGGNPVLSFTVTNLDAGSGVSQLSFSDDLDAVLPGLAAASPLPTAPCGAGSSLSGTSVLVLSGGNLAAAGQPGDSCTFQVTLQVPAGTAPGDYLNTTSQITSGGLPVADPASATLAVEPPPGFGKAFAPDAVGVGETSTLTFTIVNNASAVAATGLDFTDTLPAGLEVANPPAASTTCTGGTITAVAGSGTISYTGGTVAAGASCSVQVDVVAAAPGDHLNTSGDLTSSSGNSGTASDILTGLPPLVFGKAFNPTVIALGEVSTLTFTMENTAAVTATDMAFSDDLPTGLVVADTPNASTTCTGGTLTATAGSGQIGYSGGSLANGATCTVQVDVTATESGDLVNTSGNLTSSLGDSGSAIATITVAGAPVFTKAFASDQVDIRVPVTLTFTIDNSANTLAADDLAFTDDLPANMFVADAPNAGTTCTGGTVSASPGAGSISYSGGSVSAGSVCTVSVDVIVREPGTFENVVEFLSSSLGTSGQATASLRAVDATPIPALGPRALWLLAGLMGLLAAARLRAAG